MFCNKHNVSNLIFKVSILVTTMLVSSSLFPALGVDDRAGGRATNGVWYSGDDRKSGRATDQSINS